MNSLNVGMKSNWFENCKWMQSNRGRVILYLILKRSKTVWALKRFVIFVRTFCATTMDQLVPYSVSKSFPSYSVTFLVRMLDFGGFSIQSTTFHLNGYNCVPLRPPSLSMIESDWHEYIWFEYICLIPNERTNDRIKS